MQQHFGGYVVDTITTEVVAARAAYLIEERDMSLWIERIFPRQTARLRSAALSAAPPETDLTFAVGLPASGISDRDRFPHDRREVLAQAVQAWRTNPLGRRIVGLTTQYVLGDGITVSSEHPAANRFLKQFWEHRLNRMNTRCGEWCDELTRTGNLFVMLSTDPAGMSYVRAFPAAAIERIEAQPHDIEQPLAFWPVRTAQELDPPAWPVYDEANDHPDACGAWPTVMLHYAINRPVGAQWGESDLAPLLRWLARYANWLEDRARLNRYRNAFLFTVTGRWPTAAQRIARQNELNANPPRPGAILVSDESEQWSFLSPKLESSDANSDGLALK
ncbi:MAG: phage portal protein, partial [Anaerolineaceae bacterium]|nr:phage portal protein [Anaerolineaceae bacterium]